jgi:hypothetical protein
MGIHQAFFSGYKTVSAATHDWSISNFSLASFGSFTIAAANLQPNDLVVFVVGADNDPVDISINNGSGINLTTLVNSTSNSIERKIYYGKIGSSVPSGGISGNTTGDYAFAMVFRTPAYSDYAVTVEATNENSSAPSHNNTSVSFDENDLALLIGIVDDDFTTMTPPSDSTKIAEDRSFSGSIGSAYKKITADGTYSWGSWTTSGSDNTAAYVLKISPIDLGSLWNVTGSTNDFSSNYPINNLQIGDLVIVATTLGSSILDTIPDHPGWTTLLSGFDEPQSKLYFRKAIVDTSFTIPGGANINSDNIAVVIVRSNKNTKNIIETAAIGVDDSSGWPTIPSTNFSNTPIPSLTNDPLSLAFGFYDDNDGENSGAPTSDYTFLGINSNGDSSLMVAYSLEASSGDTAPPGAGNSFANSNNDSDNNSCVVIYASTEDRTVKTWSVVDSEFKDLGSQGSGLTVSNLQQGDFVYWTQTGDNAGTIANASGWFETFGSVDNNPSFKEQTQIIGSGVTSISVTCESDCEAGALIAFRCSSGSTSLESSAFGAGTGTSGDPVVPDQHIGTLGPSLPVTSENDCLCIVSGYLDDDTITSCTAPTGLTLAGFAGGSRMMGIWRSSLMIAYGVSLEDESGPLAGGRAFTTDGSDTWYCTTMYVNPS